MGHLEPGRSAGTTLARARGRLAAAIGLAAMTAGLPPAQASAAAGTTACNVRLNVTDQDPAGLNIRASPGGAVIGALKARGRWVRVHVTAQTGAWMRIDVAHFISEETGEEHQVFRGTGYVAVSKLGIDELNFGARILAEPAEDAGVLQKIEEGDEAKLPKAEVLGCWGNYLKVRVNGQVGWTRDFCTNQLTTCV